MLRHWPENGGHPMGWVDYEVRDNNVRKIGVETVGWLVDGMGGCEYAAGKGSSGGRRVRLTRKKIAKRR